MGLELTPTQRHTLPRLVIAGAGLTLAKVVLAAGNKIAMGAALTVGDYGMALGTCALIYAAVWFKRQNKT